MLPKRKILNPVGLLVAVVMSFCLISVAGAESYVLSREISSGSFGSLALPNDVSVGPDGKVYIADSSNFSALVLDEYGNEVGSPFSPSGQFQPEYISVGPNGDLYYVTNLYNSVFRVAADGSFIQWGSAGTGSGQFMSPTGVAAGPDGTVYVADTQNNRIQKFSPNGTFLLSWGSAGTGNGQFMNPQAVAIDSTGSVVVVADTDNNRVQAFDTNGNFILAAGTLGTDVGQFFSPAGVAFGPDSSVFISDIGNARVQKFGLDGAFRGEIGTGLLSSPHGLAVDRGGNLYVADTFNNRIAVFAPEVVDIDNGVGQVTITKPSAAAVTVDISPDSYWNNVPAEVFVWIEAPGIGSAYYLGPNNWVGFGSPDQMAPLLSGIPVGTINDYPATLVDSTAGLPSGTFTLFVCLDRQINGKYNPSSSVCGNLRMILQ